MLLENKKIVQLISQHEEGEHKCRLKNDARVEVKKGENKNEKSDETNLRFAAVQKSGFKN